MLAQTVVQDTKPGGTAQARRSPCVSAEAGMDLIERGRRDSRYRGYQR
jgi:hypothetical protein